MAYCTRANLSSRIPDRKLIQLCDEEKTALADTTLATAEASNANITARIDDAIEAGDAVIDSYIRSRYAVPLTAVPTTVKWAAVDLAIFMLFNRRAGEFEIPEGVGVRHDAVLRWLQGIAAAKLDLGVEPPDLPAPSAKVQVVHDDGGENEYTPDTLESF